MIFKLVLLSLCFASPQDPVFRKGKKIRVFMTYGNAIEGWVSQYSSSCIVISNRSGRRALDIRTVDSVEVDARRFTIKELIPLLNHKTDDRSQPKKSSIIALGVLNAGLPFALIQKKKELFITLILIKPKK